MEAESQNIEDEIDSLRDILTATQCAKLALHANRNKFREEVNFLKLDREEFEKSLPTKRVKLEPI